MSILAGALALILLEVVVTSPNASKGITAGGSLASGLVSRLVDPKVPLIGSSSSATTTSSTSSGTTLTPSPGTLVSATLN